MYRFLKRLPIFKANQYVNAIEYRALEGAIRLDCLIEVA